MNDESIIAVRALLDVLEKSSPLEDGRTWFSVVERIRCEAEWGLDISHWAIAQLPRLREAIDRVKATLPE